MERPGSARSSGVAMSGMALPGGGAVAAPPRPMTPGRQAADPSAAMTGMIAPGDRPGSSAGRAPASRAGRPPSSAGRAGVPPTAMRPGTGGGFAALRPTTQQGLGGLSTGPQGPGRQVLDKTYYMGALRAQRQDLVNEVDSLQRQYETLSQDVEQAAQLSKRHAQISKDVKGLKGQLTDFNIVLDKSHSAGGGAEAIRSEAREWTDRLDTERRKQDAAFKQRTQREQAVKDIEAQILAHQQKQEMHLAELAPDKRDRYMQLQSESSELSAIIARREDDIADLGRRINALEGEMANDAHGPRQRSAALQEQLRASRARKRELQAEFTKANMSPEARKEALMQQMRADNTAAAEAEENAKIAESEVKQLRQRLQSLDSDISESKAADRTDKLQELQQKDAEMTAFIESFEGNRNAQLQENDNLRRTIVASLERQSAKINASKELPTAARFKELKEEVKFKETQLDNAEATQGRLDDELKLRRDELDKINTLESKISVELETLSGKLQNLRDETEKFGRLDLLKEEADRTKVEHEQIVRSLGAREEGTRITADSTKAKHDAKRAQLLESTEYIALSRAEAKLRTIEASIFASADVLAARERETNYAPMIEGVMMLTQNLNAQIVSAVAR